MNPEEVDAEAERIVLEEMRRFYPDCTVEQFRGSRWWALLLALARRALSADR